MSTPFFGLYFSIFNHSEKYANKNTTDPRFKKYLLWGIFQKYGYRKNSIPDKSNFSRQELDRMENCLVHGLIIMV
jgi:hypothetical protein